MPITVDSVEATLHSKLSFKCDDMHHAFLLLDKSRSGFITVEDMWEALDIELNMGSMLAPSQMAALSHALIAKWDTSTDGKVSYKEYCAAFLQPGHGDFLPGGEESTPPPTNQRREITAPRATENRPASKMTPEEEEANRRSANTCRDRLKNKMYQYYEDLRTAFLKIDSDRSGYVGAEEWIHLWERHNMNKKHAQLLFDEVDKNKDGKINYGEFVKIMDLEAKKF